MTARAAGTAVHPPVLLSRRVGRFPQRSYRGGGVALLSRRGKGEVRICGVFRESNRPRRRIDETFAMDLQGFLETTDGATIMPDDRGDGRSRKRSDDLYASAAIPPEAAKCHLRLVGFARHVTESPKDVGPNDAVGAIVGEVFAPAPGSTSGRSDVKLVLEASELVREPVPEQRRGLAARGTSPNPLPAAEVRRGAARPAIFGRSTLALAVERRGRQPPRSSVPLSRPPPSSRARAAPRWGRPRRSPH
jgi:hypothetical protein